MFSLIERTTSSSEAYLGMKKRIQSDDLAAYCFEESLRILGKGNSAVGIYCGRFRVWVLMILTLRGVI